jgi:hypothetical protein
MVRKKVFATCLGLCEADAASYLGDERPAHFCQPENARLRLLGAPPAQISVLNRGVFLGLDALSCSRQILEAKVFRICAEEDAQCAANGKKASSGGFLLAPCLSHWAAAGAYLFGLKMPPRMKLLHRPLLRTGWSKCRMTEFASLGPGSAI